MPNAIPEDMIPSLRKWLTLVMYPTGKAFYLDGGSVVTRKFGDKSKIPNMRVM